MKENINISKESRITIYEALRKYYKLTLFIWSQRLLNYLAFKSFSVPGDGYSKNVLIIFPQCFVNGNPRFLADIYVLLHPSINSFLCDNIENLLV
jgi:hypothetical protein